MRIRQRGRRCDGFIGPIVSYFRGEDVFSLQRRKGCKGQMRGERSVLNPGELSFDIETDLE
jgi:hypothetical protein